MSRIASSRRKASPELARRLMLAYQAVKAAELRADLESWHSLSSDLDDISDVLWREWTAAENTGRTLRTRVDPCA